MLWTVETHATCYEEAFLSAKPVLPLCYDMAMQDKMTHKSQYSQTLMEGSYYIKKLNSIVEST